MYKCNLTGPFILHPCPPEGRLKAGSLLIRSGQKSEAQKRSHPRASRRAPQLTRAGRRTRAF